LPEANWPGFQAEDQSIHVEEADVFKETSEKADASSKHGAVISDLNAVETRSNHSGS